MGAPSWLKALIFVLVLATIITLPILFIPPLMHWLGIHLGVMLAKGASYSPYVNFWGGFGSDITEFAVIGSVAGLYYKHNCHEDRCWRIGRHQVEGTPWCNKHHERARKTSE